MVLKLERASLHHGRLTKVLVVRVHFDVITTGSGTISINDIRMNVLLMYTYESRVRISVSVINKHGRRFFFAFRLWESDPTRLRDILDFTGLNTFIVDSQCTVPKRQEASIDLKSCYTNIMLYVDHQRCCFVEAQTVKSSI